MTPGRREQIHQYGGIGGLENVAQSKMNQVDYAHFVYYSLVPLQAASIFYGLVGQPLLAAAGLLAGFFGCGSAAVPGRRFCLPQFRPP